MFSKPLNNTVILQRTLGAASLALILSTCPAWAQEGRFFDGDFESGTFQGWTPDGENGGFATLAAKGTCYSGNDTTAISFNGNERSNYAALLRSNADGDTNSVAKLRSLPFPPGSAVYFSALSETTSRRNDKPVDLVVNILDSAGNIVSEQPYRTAVIELVPGCPSEARDAAFSIHSIDTHGLEGEIMIEFAQHTNSQGQGFFTLIDNVFTLPKGQIILSQSQPVAVAGTSVTSSGTLYLDPTRSFDPDEKPEELHYSWFINGEDSVRHFDKPCINIDASNALTAGNHTATLYVNDGFHYSADTLNFVVSGVAETELSETADPNNPLNTNPNVTLTNPDGSAFVTLTDPSDECDVDLSEQPVDPEDPTDPGDPGDPGNGGGTSPTLDLDSGSDGSGFTSTFTIGTDASVAVAGAVSIGLADSTDPIVSATVVIANPRSVDSLVIGELNIPSLVIPDPSAGTTSLVISQADAANPATAAEFEQAIGAVGFSYEPSGDADTTSRVINISVSDGNSNSNTAQALITIQ